MIGKRILIKFKNRGAKCKSDEVSINVKLGKNSSIGRKVKINDNVAIGDYSYINYETIIDSNTQIGKFCSIGPQVYIAPGNHPLEYVSTHPFLYDYFWQKKIGKVVKSNKVYKKTIIENDVWIGARAIILSGVKVSNGSIIAAGAVVTKDVPPYSIVAGVPARIIRHRFDEEKIKKLEEIKWWNFSNERMLEEYEKFFSIDTFIK